MTPVDTSTPEVVAPVWHKWFGDSFGETADEPEAPTSGMTALAAGLRASAASFSTSLRRVAARYPAAPEASGRGMVQAAP